MADEYFRKVLTTIILAILVVLSYFLLKPLLMAIVIGIILAFIFTPIFDWTNKYIKKKNISATLMCVLLILLIVVPLWYLTPLLVNQSLKFYLASQQINFIKPLESIFPSLFQYESLSSEVASALRQFVSDTTTSLVDSLSEFIMNFPVIFLQSIVVFFTFFFVVRDKEKLVSYLQSLMPFSKDVEKKLFKSSKDITVSVLYGQVVIGIIQGLIVGIGFFIFRVPNALLFMALAALAGIFPIIGTAIVWIPVAIYFLIAGNNFAAFGIILFGLMSTIIETMIKPVFVSRRIKMNSSIILIGMIGGLFMFGIMGVILGPLILAYLLIILEIYRDKKLPGVFIEDSKDKN